MKVVKRDGRVVDYDQNKILIAIRKANAEVDPFERVSEDDIDGIIASIEATKSETIQVEDIQDLIEQKLMAAGKFILAKTYIIYRYTRELVRKANTTDDSIMSLIQNSNKDVMEENVLLMLNVILIVAILLNVLIQIIVLQKKVILLKKKN